MSYQNFKTNVLESRVPLAAVIFIVNVISLGGVKRIDDFCSLIFILSLPMMALSSFFWLQKWAKEMRKSEVLLLLEKVILFIFVAIQILDFLEKISSSSVFHSFGNSLYLTFIFASIIWFRGFLKEVLLHKKES